MQYENESHDHEGIMTIGSDENEPGDDFSFWKDKIFEDSQFLA